MIADEIIPIEILDEKYSEFFYDWFIDNLFLESASSANKFDFMVNIGKMTWIFET